jgi:hypothetical protein
MDLLPILSDSQSPLRWQRGDRSGQDDHTVLDLPELTTNVKIESVVLL